jgi:MSHA biogenesis protein MshP
MRPSVANLRGFAIVSAIFILVVLAVLGAFIVSISTNQQIGSAIDVQGVRAYQAARAGIEWGLYKVQSTPAYNFSYGNVSPLEVGKADPNGRSCANVSPNPSSFDVFGFSVTVSCAAHADGTIGGPTVYLLTSTACLPAGGSCPNASPGSQYIERRLEVSF